MTNKDKYESAACLLPQSAMNLRLIKQYKHCTMLVETAISQNPAAIQYTDLRYLGIKI